MEQSMQVGLGVGVAVGDVVLGILMVVCSIGENALILEGCTE